MFPLSLHTWNYKLISLFSFFFDVDLLSQSGYNTWAIKITATVYFPSLIIINLWNPHVGMCATCRHAHVQGM